MAPEGLLELLGRQGGPRAKTASERLLGGLLAALGALLGPSWRFLGLSWAPGGLPDPGILREVIFDVFFGGRRRDPEISCVLMIVCLFSILCWRLFLTIGCRPCGKAGANAHLEKTRFRLESVSNLAFRPLACTAKKHRNKAEKEKRKQAKNTIRTALGRKTTKF